MTHDRYDKGDLQTDSSLEELGVDNIRFWSTKRLKYVLEKLDEADELSRELVWKSELWENVTVEEMLGALIEADRLLARHEEREVIVTDEP